MVEIAKVDTSGSTARLLSGAINKSDDMILRHQTKAPQANNNRPAAIPNPGTKSKAFD